MSVHCEPPYQALQRQQNVKQRNPRVEGYHFDRRRHKQLRVWKKIEDDMNNSDFEKNRRRHQQLGFWENERLQPPSPETVANSEKMFDKS